MSDLSPATPKRTPLFSNHVAAGAKLVEFGGWEMPVQFSSILEEHRAVREQAGVFDISHMGQVGVRGPSAMEQLETILTNGLHKLADGTGQYTLLLDTEGGVIDDLLAYRIAADHFFLVVNAAKIDEDLQWLRSAAGEGMQVALMDQNAGIALQGPASATVLEKSCGISTPPPRNAIRTFGEMQIARTGYTGEDGFEIFLPAGKAGNLWKALLGAGAHPCGLGARDTLRLEKCYPLNGSDLSRNRSPVEAGLMAFVDMGKKSFVGKKALEDRLAAPPAEKLVALRMDAKGPPPRAHYPVLDAAGKRIGEVTSGTLSPSLGIGIGMAYIDPEHSRPGTPVTVDVRGRGFAATVTRKPLYPAAVS